MNKKKYEVSSFQINLILGMIIFIKIKIIQLILLEIFNNEIRQTVERNVRCNYWKGKAKLSLFAANMIVYLDKLRESTEKQIF